MEVDEIVRKVLVLEDGRIFSESLVSALERLGYNPIPVVSTEEAGEAVQQHEFYAAILDNECPHKKYGPARINAGIVFAFELRGLYPGMRVAMHTLTRFDQHDREYIKSKGISLIAKGADDEEFRQFLEN